MRVLLLSLLFVNLCFIKANNITHVVGRDGNLSNIVIDNSNDKVIHFAATELQRYVYKMTGKHLTITTENHPNSFVLRQVSNSNIRWDGYEIETNEKGIIIEANMSRGILYGVYSLLEEQGCSFVYPDPDEEIVPAKKQLLFCGGRKTYNPKIEHRGAVPNLITEKSVDMARRFFDWMAKNRLNYVIVCEERFGDNIDGHVIEWKKVTHKLLPELQKRGFHISMSEHCTHLFFPRDNFETHPEWFALHNGSRRKMGQICYSNKKAVEYLARNISDYVRAHPEFSTIGTWPLDGGNYCSCDQCRNAETMYRATSFIAKEIKKVRPDIIVEHLAYHKENWIPPTENSIDNNMSVLWCPVSSPKMDSIARCWVEKSKNAQGVYQLEYYMGDHYRMRSHVLLRPYYMAQNVEYCHEMGFRGIIPIVITIENWYKYGFNMWMFGKASWDDFKGVDAALNLYYKNYYGSYSSEAKSIFTHIFSKITPEPYTESMSINNYDDVALFISESEKVIKQIEGLTSRMPDNIVRKRFDRIRVYLEYYRLHRELMVERTPEALNRLTDYNEKHRNFNEVLIYTKYIIQTFKNQIIKHKSI